MMVRVRDIDCEIGSYEEENYNLFRLYNNTIDDIGNILKLYIPIELKESLGLELNNIIDDGVDFMIRMINESQKGCIIGDFVEKTLEFIYEKIEIMDDVNKEDYIESYIRVKMPKSKTKRFKEMLNDTNILTTVTGDPMELAVMEAVDNAYSRGVRGVDELKEDAYDQLYAVINESDIFYEFAEDYILKNSL